LAQTSPDMDGKPAGARIEAVRHFNRDYTRRIGVLREGLLDSPFSLTQARVLYELAHREEPTATALGQELGLDAGYLSRILRQFERRRLIARRRSANDSRQVSIALTARGRKVQRDLDQRSHHSVDRMLAGLRRSDRQRLVTSLAEVHRTLSPQSSGNEAATKSAAVKKPAIVLREHGPGDIGWAIARHGELYAGEFGWNAEFEGFVAVLFGNLTKQPPRAGEKLWIAEIGGERVGCVFVVRNEEDPKAAQLRCLLVDPKARGMGVGRRLVEECVQFAKDQGYRRMVLWTNDVLVAARRIYEAAGFELVGENRHHSFGKKLNGQTWALEFAPAQTSRA